MRGGNEGGNEGRQAGARRGQSQDPAPRLSPVGSRGWMVLHTTYGAKFKTVEGTARTVIGVTEAALSVREGQYRAKSKAAGTPAFALPASPQHPAKLTKLGKATTSRRQGFTSELCWTGWTMQGSATWRTDTRGACFCMPSWSRWSTAQREACERLVAELPPTPDEFGPEVVAVVEGLERDYEFVKCHAPPFPFFLFLPSFPLSSIFFTFIFRLHQKVHNPRSY